MEETLGTRGAGEASLEPLACDGRDRDVVVCALRLRPAHVHVALGDVGALRAKHLGPPSAGRGDEAKHRRAIGLELVEQPGELLRGELAPDGLVVSAKSGREELHGVTREDAEITRVREHSLAVVELLRDREPTHVAAIAAGLFRARVDVLDHHRRAASDERGHRELAAPEAKEVPQLLLRNLESVIRAAVAHEVEEERLYATLER